MHGLGAASVGDGKERSAAVDTTSLPPKRLVAPVAVL
jgi:hypothetical protein